MAAERRALLVLGMHRSGTSALTRVLNLHGAYLPDNLLPANSGNETGYWESSAVVAFNDAALAARGTSWDSPVHFSLPPVSEDVHREEVHRLEALIGQEFGDAPLLVIKDPRLCRLFPLWMQALEALDIQPLPLLITRDPGEIAASLYRRDGMPHDLAFLLWLQYMLAAELDSRSLPRMMLSFDRLLEAPAQTIRAVEQQFGIQFPANDEAAAHQARTFLRPSLRRVVDPAERRPMPRWVAVAHACLAGGAVDVATLDTLRADLSDMEPAIAGTVRWGARQADQRRAQLEGDVAWWRSQYDRLSTTVAEEVNKAYDLSLQRDRLAERYRVLLNECQQLQEQQNRLALQLETPASSETELRALIESVRQTVGPGVSRVSPTERSAADPQS
jgi:hypothetical protein